MYRSARAKPTRFCVGVDSNADNLAEISRRAGRKPARGGASNALFVHATAEALPPELAGLATRVTILLPWGSLLRAVAQPDPVVLAGVRGLCRPGARLEVVMAYAERDPTTAGALAPLERERLLREVLPRYRAAGFVATVGPLTAAEVRQLGTTWAARLAFGRERPFWRLRARAI
ncbi:MAG TPA: class I SAM-dependent methyltransferase [Polyangia bacterium]|nr:class I SAM-dependent methyltransferase [Polyangia bacterium]